MAKKKNKSASLIGKIFVIGNCAILGGVTVERLTHIKDYIPARAQDGTVDFDTKNNVTIQINDADLRYQTELSVTTQRGKNNVHSNPAEGTAMLLKVDSGTTYEELIRGSGVEDADGNILNDGYGLKATSKKGATITGFYLST